MRPSALYNALDDIIDLVEVMLAARADVVLGRALQFADDGHSWVITDRGLESLRSPTKTLSPAELAEQPLVRLRLKGPSKHAIQRRAALSAP